jgi:hypothetical protein
VNSSAGIPPDAAHSPGRFDATSTNEEPLEVGTYIKIGSREGVIQTIERSSEAYRSHALRPVNLTFAGRASRGLAPPGEIG